MSPQRAPPPVRILSVNTLITCLCSCALIILSCDSCASAPIPTLPTPRSSLALPALLPALAAGDGGGSAATLESISKKQPLTREHSPFNMRITAEVNGNGLEIMTPGHPGANHSHFQVLNTFSNGETSNEKNDTADADAEADKDNGSWILSPFLDKSAPNRLVRKFGYLISLIGFGLSWIGYQLVSCSNYVAGFGNWIEEFGMVVVGVGNWLALKTVT